MTHKSWALIDTKYFKTKLFYDKDDTYRVSINIHFRHTNRVTERRGLFISLLGFTIQIYQNN
jgi:hypothetical protein